jgi:Domain of unknown function (DUF4398)
MNTKFLTGVGIALAIAGCASTPKFNETLESARSTVQAAEADPNAAKYAALDLQTAKTDLAAADAAFSRHDEPGIAQPAYMATQNARLAQLRGAAKADRRSATASYSQHGLARLTAPIALRTPQIERRMRQKSPAIKPLKIPRGCRRKSTL